MSTAIKKRKVLKYKKLHLLLADCLTDLRWAERSKKYEVDMDYYVRKHPSSLCRVCLAGACIVRRSDEHPERGFASPDWFNLNPDHFHPETSKVMRAADSLRRGDVMSAASVLGLPPIEGFNCDIPSYHTRSEAWWKAMRKMLRDLRAANI